MEARNAKDPMVGSTDYHFTKGTMDGKCYVVKSVYMGRDEDGHHTRRDTHKKLVDGFDIDAYVYMVNIFTKNTDPLSYGLSQVCEKLYYMPECLVEKYALMSKLA